MRGFIFRQVLDVFQGLQRRALSGDAQSQIDCFGQSKTAYRETRCLCLCDTEISATVLGFCVFGSEAVESSSLLAQSLMPGLFLLEQMKNWKLFREILTNYCYGSIFFPNVKSDCDKELQVNILQKQSY